MTEYKGARVEAIDIESGPFNLDERSAYPAGVDAKTDATYRRFSRALTATLKQGEQDLFEMLKGKRRKPDGDCISMPFGLAADLPRPLHLVFRRPDGTIKERHELTDAERRYELHANGNRIYGKMGPWPHFGQVDHEKLLEVVRDAVRDGRLAYFDGDSAFVTAPKYEEGDRVEGIHSGRFGTVTIVTPAGPHVLFDGETEAHCMHGTLHVRPYKKETSNMNSESLATPPDTTTTTTTAETAPPELAGETVEEMSDRDILVAMVADGIREGGLTAEEMVTMLSTFGRDELATEAAEMARIESELQVEPELEGETAASLETPETAGSGG